MEIANALQLEAARRHASDSPLHAKFEVAQPILFSYSVFAADILLYAMTLTLTFDLKHLQCIAIRLWRDETSYQIQAHSSKPRRSDCHFNIWTNDLEHVSCVALCSGIIFTTFELNQPIHTRIIAFFAAVTLCHAVTLTYNPLTLNICGRSSVVWTNYLPNLSEID